MSTLTLLTLNPASRRCRHDMADPHAMHRTLMALYPHTPEAAARYHLGVLWRAEPGDPPTLLLQSHTAPDVGALPYGYATAQTTGHQRLYLQALAAGQIVRYRLTANPARTLRAGGTNSQKTVPAAEIGDWWQRRAQSIGLNPVDTPTDHRTARPPDQPRRPPHPDTRHTNRRSSRNRRRRRAPRRHPRRRGPGQSMGMRAAHRRPPPR